MSRPTFHAQLKAVYVVLYDLLEENGILEYAGPQVWAKHPLLKLLQAEGLPPFIIDPGRGLVLSLALLRALVDSVPPDVAASKQLESIFLPPPKTT